MIKEGYEGRKQEGYVWRTQDKEQDMQYWISQEIKDIKGYLYLKISNCIQTKYPIIPNKDIRMLGDNRI
jgi:hypothetical protein